MQEYTRACANALRVCLFGGEMEWIENFGKKMGRKTFLESVWLGGKEGK